MEGEINEKLTTTFKLLPWSAKKKSQFLLKALITDNDYMVYPEIPDDFLDSSTQDVNELFYQAIQDKWDALPNLHSDANYDEKRPYNKLLYILLHQEKNENSIAREISLKTKIAINVRGFIELAELNLAQEYTKNNIEQAESWLYKAQQHQDKSRHSMEIKRLEITLFEAKQQPQKALELQWQIFTKTEQFSDYQKLQNLAENSGVDKTECYRQAEAILIKNSTNRQHSRRYDSGYNLVEFYLKSSQIVKAAEYAKNNNVGNNQLQQIAKEIISSNAKLAFEFYQRIAMSYPQLTNNTAYQQTIEVLIELKQSLPDDTNWGERFEILLDEIKQAYKPKRNLMKLLDQNFG